MYKDDVLEELKKFKVANQDIYGILALGLFGSVAKDNANEESDIDVCVKTKNADMFAMVHMKEELQKLLSKSVDIVRVRDKMNPYLKKRIEKEAIYV
ncbi:MAG TPA: nucleotidyltransferase [Sulfurimonas sp. UBA12504]|nr:MAG: nucleotidyltransferase [Sulfurimonas sp. GWF2_37_8]DAB29477.1 MAG TPA: nucleotidyltransferase [Sulfurimonas sp. UBA12504]